MSRLEDLKRFYEILDRLESKIGGERTLARCDGRMNWPQRGVYFFREPSEERSDSGNGLRIVRVGTHATTGSSRTKLWSRLKAHKGIERSGGGDHRSSVFRRAVGEALIKRDGIECPTWDLKNKDPRVNSSVREREFPLEQAVSSIVGGMPFLWLAVAGREDRAYIERNTTALLSNYERLALDSPSGSWLGYCSPREKVRGSGQWSSEYVEDLHAPEFLHVLESAVEGMGVYK